MIAAIFRLPEQNDETSAFAAEALDKLVIAMSGILAMVALIAVA
ncbi:MAG TPA: hypothetical protein VHV26_09595 [Rhizomicrobium sp.]|jgi:hypothetical protein|nr:hypothetical protein [Rhizomicrobium sp.]